MLAVFSDSYEGYKRWCEVRGVSVKQTCHIKEISQLVKSINAVIVVEVQPQLLESVVEAAQNLNIPCYVEK
jgi:hypothetical protein